MNQLNALDTTFEKLTNSLNQFGLNLPDSDFSKSESFDHAKNVDPNLLFQINTSLQSYIDLINDGPLAEESEEAQTKRHLKKFLTKFGLTVSDKVFKVLTDKHLVEVNSLSHQQIYRSINFFKLCSYDLGALTFIPWNKLFHRPEEITKKMFEEINYVIQNNIEYMTPNIPVHFLTELCSEKKFGYKFYKIAIVEDAETGAPMGYLTIISVKNVLDQFQLLH